MKEMYQLDRYEGTLKIMFQFPLNQQDDKVEIQVF
jgi:hypothetical protein